jgi:hypothetical protein
VVPFVVPPLKSSASAGGAAGQLARPVAMEDGVVASEAITELRTGVHPFQLVDRAGTRRWDLGAGYLFQTTAGDAMVDLWRHGPFVEVGLRLWRRPVSDSTAVRVGVHAGAELLFDRDDTVGGGGSVGASLELVTWSSGPFQGSGRDGIVVGGAEGETSVGLVANASYRAVADTEYWTLTMGVSLRSPGLLGLAIFIPTRS